MPAAKTTKVKEEPEDDEQDDHQYCYTIDVKKQISKRMGATPTSVKKAETKIELHKSAKAKAKAKENKKKATAKARKEKVKAKTGEKEVKSKARAKAKAAKEKADPKAKAEKRRLKINAMILAQRNKFAQKEGGGLTEAKDSAGSNVRVKQEPGASVKMKLEPGASAKKAPPGQAEKCKAMLAAVKKEPGGLSRNPREHFRHQVAFIEQVISGPWDLCWGSLGTGIVGVCQRGIAAFDPAEGAGQGTEAEEGLDDTVGGRRQERKKNKKNSAPARGEEEGAEPEGAEAAEGVDDTVKGSSSSSSAPARGKTEGAEPEGEEAEEGVGDTDGGSISSSSRRSAPARGQRLSREAVIILFKNAPTCNLQTRNGMSIGGYIGALDVESLTLAWSSQRRDVHGRLLQAIVDHIGREGRVIVAVRPPASTEYRVLGQVTRISGVREAETLLLEGDTVLQELGTKTVHKAIGPTCLSATLRAGVGLTTVSYESNGWKTCKSCCFSPAQAVLHFDELEDAGVCAYLLEKGSKLEETQGSSVATDRPLKRIRRKKASDAEVAPMAVAVKQEPGGGVVKQEPSEESEPGVESR